MLVLRTERRALGELDRVVGPWPGVRAGRSRLRTGSPAQAHAKAVWTGARAAVGRARIEGDENFALSLAFVEAVARHVQGCRKCERPGQLDDVSAGEWLMQGLRNVPSTRAVVDAVLAAGQPPGRHRTRGAGNRRRVPRSTGG